jgi:hypothetical protein
MEVSGQLHAPAALPREKTWYTRNKKLLGIKDGLGGFEEDKLSYLSRDSNPGPSSS